MCFSLSLSWMISHSQLFPMFYARWVLVMFFTFIIKVQKIITKGYAFAMFLAGPYGNNLVCFFWLFWFHESKMKIVQMFISVICNYKYLYIFINLFVASRLHVRLFVHSNFDYRILQLSLSILGCSEVSFTWEKISIHCPNCSPQRLKLFSTAWFIFLLIVFSFTVIIVW